MNLGLKQKKLHFFGNFQGKKSLIPENNIFTCGGINRTNAAIEGLEARFTTNARLMIGGSGFESWIRSKTNLAQRALLHSKHAFKTSGMATIGIHQFSLFTRIILTTTDWTLALSQAFTAF